MPLKSTEEMYASTLRAHHALGVVDDIVHVSKSQYERATAGATDAGFVLGVDLEWISGASER
eukprot:scaffold599926_cov17-Prasinocladus_malaysianus.AAC.1